MRRRSSMLWAFVFLILSGGIGILAGYGALRLWHDHMQAASAERPADDKQPVSPTPSTSSPQLSRSARRSPAPQTNTSTRSAAANKSKAGPIKATPRPMPDPTVVEPATAPEPSPPPTTAIAPSISAAAAIKARPQVSVDLDLTRNRQQQVLDAAAKDVHIAVLEGCDTEYEIKPDSIVIKAPRDIAIGVSWDNLPTGKRRLTLEPTVTTDAGKKLPFTVRNMENIKRQAGQEGEQATAALAALKLEQKNLNEYIKSAARRTVGQDNAARYRIDQLKKLIPVADGQLKTLQADYEAAARMSELADALNEKCRILLDDSPVVTPPVATSMSATPPGGTP